MSKIAILFLIIIIFLIFSIAVLLSMKGGRNNNAGNTDTLSVKLDKGSAINIYQDEDSSIRVEYTSYEDRPRAVELFPDLVEDLTEEYDILGRDFWDRYADFQNQPPEQQKDIISKLVAHGYVRYDDAYNFEIDTPLDDDGNEISLPPDPAYEDEYRTFWTKPWN